MLMNRHTKNSHIMNVKEIYNINIFLDIFSDKNVKMANILFFLHFLLLFFKTFSVKFLRAVSGISLLKFFD